MKQIFKLFFFVLLNCLTVLYGISQVTITPVSGTYTCSGNGTVKLRLPKSKAAYEWTNTQTSTIIGSDSTITVSPGTYSARYKETIGGAWLSVSAYTVAQIVPTTPVISANGSTSGVFCGTSSIILSSTTATNYTWSRGATAVGSSQTLTVSGNSIVTGGNYSFSVSTTDAISSCSATSNTITLSLYPSAPSKPTITPDGSLSLCTGGSVGLSSSYSAGSNIWTKTVGVSVTTTGTTKLTVSDANTVYVVAKDNNGCLSPASDAVTTTMNTYPSAPVVTPSGTVSICAGDSILLSSDNKGAGTYTWSNAATGQTIYAKTAGTYSVKFKNTAGCESSSSNIVTVVVNALPATPTISAGGITTFCNGGSVTLSSSYTAGNNLWSRSVGGDTTTTAANTIRVRVSNTITVRAVNINGCKSSASSPITITVNPVPTAPIITPSGTVKICAGDSILLSSDNKGTGTYLWSNAKTTQTIYVKTAGTYNLTFTNSFGCQSPVSNSVAVVVNTLPTKPTITADGPIIFCEGFTVGLSSSYTAYKNVWYRNTDADTTTSTTTKLIIRKSSIITVRALDANGCYSVASDPITTKMNARPATPILSVVTYTNNPILQNGVNLGVCTGDSVQLGVVNSYTKGTFLWTDTRTTKNIVIKTAGNYSVIYTDTLGCKSVVSPVYTVTINGRPAQPVIGYSSALEFCAGGQVVLTSSQSDRYLWNTGETTPFITVRITGNYNVIAINDKGCRSVLASANVPVTVNPLPAKPIVTANGPLTFCPDKNVTLTSTVSETQYIWTDSTSATQSTSFDRAITINKSGVYSVQTKSAKGCVSPSSEKSRIVVLVAPLAPTIYALTPTSVCEGNTVSLVALYANGNVEKFSWRNEDTQEEIATTATVILKTSGQYSVKVQDSQTCNSAYSSIQIVKINALPTKPVIQAVNGKIICDGDSALLRSSLPNTLPNGTASYKWTFNGTLLTVITRDLYVKGAGGYAVQVTDANGCQSVAYSDTAKITVNPLPTVPIITAVGQNPFCADRSLILNSSADVGYKWSNGASTRSITINQAGLYTVQTINGYKCLSKPSNPIEAKVNALPASTNIFAGGNTIFCSGDSVQINTISNFKAYWWVGTDSLGYGANNVWYAKRGGNYTVRVQDFNGCFSPASTQRFVDVRNTPITPVVTQIGSYTIESAGDGDANGYEWLLNGKVVTGNTKDLKVRIDGNYQVRSSFTYTPIALPDNRLVCYSKISLAKAFKADPNLDGLSIYPNPSNTGIFTVEVAEDLVGAQVSVYDLAGRSILNYVVDKFDSRKQVDLSNQPFNSFILRVKLDGYEKTKHISVIR